MVHREEAVAEAEPILFLLHRRAGNLDRTSALQADQVIVMPAAHVPLVFAAVALRGGDLPDDAGLDQQRHRPIKRSPMNMQPAMPGGGHRFLHAEMIAARLDDVEHRQPVASRP